MRLSVFGANGPTGRLVVSLATERGHDVVAVTRHPADFPTGGPRLTVLGADVHDRAAVRTAVDGADAVVSTLGVPFTKDEVTVYSQGGANILRAMSATGVKRLVAVTSSVLAPDPEPVGGVVFRKVLQPYVVGKLGRTVYEDMRRLEQLIRRSDVDWTIVRPSGLCRAAEVSDYLVAPEHVAHRFTTRIDLADCLVREAVDGDHRRAAIGIGTPSANPSMLSLIWREGIRKRP